MTSVGRTRATSGRATAQLDARPNGRRETYGEALGGGLCTRKKKERASSRGNRQEYIKSRSGHMNR